MWYRQRDGTFAAAKVGAKAMSRSCSPLTACRANPSLRLCTTNRWCPWTSRWTRLPTAWHSWLATRACGRRRQRGCVRAAQAMRLRRQRCRPSCRSWAPWQTGALRWHSPCRMPSQQQVQHPGPWRRKRTTLETFARRLAAWMISAVRDSLTGLATQPRWKEAMASTLAALSQRRTTMGTSVKPRLLAQTALHISSPQLAACRPSQASPMATAARTAVPWNAHGQRRHTAAA